MTQCHSVVLTPFGYRMYGKGLPVHSTVTATDTSHRGVLSYVHHISSYVRWHHFISIPLRFHFMQPFFLGHTISLLVSPAWHTSVLGSAFSSPLDSQHLLETLFTRRYSTCSYQRKVDYWQARSGNGSCRTRMEEWGSQKCVFQSSLSDHSLCPLACCTYCAQPLVIVYWQLVFAVGMAGLPKQNCIG